MFGGGAGGGRAFVYGGEPWFGDARFSVDGARRHILVRTLAAACRERVDSLAWPAPCLWIGFNPSSAGADRDDPTVRREMGFTRRTWGAWKYCKANLCDIIATSPKALPAGADLSDDGREQIDLRLWAANHVVCAWGGLADGRDALVEGVWSLVRAELARRRRVGRSLGIWCLGRTAGGQPRHPLYVAGDTPLEAWGGP